MRVLSREVSPRESLSSAGPVRTAAANGARLAPHPRPFSRTGEGRARGPEHGLGRGSRRAASAPRRQAPSALLRCPPRSSPGAAPPGDCAGPTRRFAAMAFAARSRPEGRAGQQRPWRMKGPSRAEGSRRAERAPRSELAQSRANPWR